MKGPDLAILIGLVFILGLLIGQLSVVVALNP